MEQKWLVRVIAAIGLLAPAIALAAPEKTPPRGELLYQNHCIACHTEHVHWREQRLAKDWQGLLHQVRRWQTNTGLRWDDEDIRAVAQYLNSRYYRFPSSGDSRTASKDAASQ
ncbi:MAG: cytochrome c [Lacisediminimonas sp.]|nr:cytochrome c [Lacisediminimonas sp.]